MNNEKMKRRDKQRYVTPALLQQAEILLEQNLLARSVVDKMNEGGIVTKPQEITNENFDNGSEYNFKWE